MQASGRHELVELANAKMHYGKYNGKLLSATALGKLKDKSYKEVIRSLEGKGMIVNDEITENGKKSGITTKSNAKGDRWIVYPESMKDILNQTLKSIDCEKIATINGKLNETKVYAQHLLSVTASIANADKIVKKFKNELPISAAGSVPTCGICMAVPIDSSLTCGHLGCEECLMRCESTCPFCKRSAGIIKLFL